MKKTLYDRLGGYAAISELVHYLIYRVQERKARRGIWRYREFDRINRGKRLLVDHLCTVAGGTLSYADHPNCRQTQIRDSMKISTRGWSVFMSQLNGILGTLNFPEPERSELLAAIDLFEEGTPRSLDPAGH